MTMAKKTQHVSREEHMREDTARVLEAVSQLDGFTPFHRHLQELAAIRQPLRAWDKTGVFPQRHLLVSLNPGEGRSTLLAHFHAFLKESRLYPGSRKIQPHACRLFEKVFAEPVSSVIPEDMPFTELEEDLKYYDSALVGLTIDDWPGRMDASPFRKLMSWCREKQRQFLFVFFVPGLEPAALERVRLQLAEHLPIRLIQLAPATDDALTHLAVQRLNACGITCPPDLHPHFRHLLIRERSDGRFHGRAPAMKRVPELQLARAPNAVAPNASGPAWQATEADFLPAPPLWQPPAGTENISGLAQLHSLVGLHHVKAQLMEIIETMKLTRDHGGTAAWGERPRPCHHLLFTGGPGTGKTEVARLFGRILREEGLLPVGDLLETNRYDLVGQCIGHTGPRTMAVCQAAMGSVLFVDEAYQLAAHEDAGSSRDFGQEALGALIAEKENHRDRFIVILAGYREEMESLYRLNPGLRDRIPHMLHFPHYTREELLALYLGMIAKKGVSDEALAARVKQYLHTLPDAFLSSRELGNARFVRNLVERTVIKALMRTQLIPAHAALPVRFRF
jgi:stage V sporulation protein K